MGNARFNNTEVGFSSAGLLRALSCPVVHFEISSESAVVPKPLCPGRPSPVGEDLREGQDLGQTEKPQQFPETLQKGLLGLSLFQKT